MEDTDTKFNQDKITGRFIPSGKPIMAASPITVRLPEDIDQIVRSLPNRTEFLRQAISQAVGNLNSSQPKRKIKKKLDNP